MRPTDADPVHAHNFVSLPLNGDHWWNTQINVVVYGLLWYIQIQLFCLNSKQKRNTIDSFCKKRPHSIQNWWTFSTFVSLNIFVISWIQMDIELWQPSFYRFAYSFRKKNKYRLMHATKPVDSKDVSFSSSNIVISITMS